jgi:hypothetical protein
VLRAVAFLVRDENWGTYIPVLSNLKVQQREDGFSVSYHAVCKSSGREIAFDCSIEGKADGSLKFDGVAIPKMDFLTARTGFVVLHPLKGVAGHKVEVEHVDGKIVKDKFPAVVNPVQPFLHIRSLTHEVLPGVKATVRMEGDTWEMEDHRNWTDASFKTYVRPLALPWPYTLKAGEAVRQSVSLSLSGSIPKAGKLAGGQAVELRLGAVTRKTLPPIGLGMPAEEIDHAIRQLEWLKLLAPKYLVCQFDPRQKHGVKELIGYRVLCDQTGADCVLEVVVESLDKFAQELAGLARLISESGLKVSSIAVVPVGDLKSVLPGGDRPPAPKLEDLYAAARAAFPGIKLGGGMFTFFTELNRKHPPAPLLDYVVNTTCPIVHAADDRSVMETLEALPFQVTTARTYISKTGYRIGPSAIGCRDNPHGKTWTPNPSNERVCLTKLEPRQRGLFGAAWTLGYIATFAATDVEAISMGAPTGPLGFIYRKDAHAQPYFDTLGGAAVFPGFHVMAGLTRSSGAKLVSVTSSDASRVACLACKTKGGTTLWLANLTAGEVSVKLSGATGAMFATTLDQDSFAVATTQPRKFQAAYKALGRDTLKLKPYAVAIVSAND